MEQKRIRITEAITAARSREDAKGKDLSYGGIAQRIWRDSNEVSARQNLFNLRVGKSTRVDYDIVKNICKVLGCDANFLFNIKSKNNG